ncbi:MAG: TraR/DksA family transcriptional regulator [Chloroflexi bacterium]|nr:MAG: TraR/DksA family transcriptional regulator [Chloroflexota bacterium]TMF14252.1 MAG: TraR/DksA family transcriptional regulator [Chloroflexota bacterium]
MDTHAARGRLIAERERLEGVRQAADRLGAGAREAAERELSSADQHPAELATETIERELDWTVVRHAEAELAEIDAALARLDASTYGSCEACGQPISDARLDALPAARYCVEDQAKVARARRNGHR